MLGFDYSSVLFRQFVRNSIVGLEVGVGEEIELAVLGGTAAFNVIEVEPKDATPVSEKTEVELRVDSAKKLEKQMAELRLGDDSEKFVGFEEQVKTLCSVLELRMNR